MDRLLLAPEPQQDSAEPTLAELTQHVTQLQAGFANLQRENAILRQQVGFWKSCHERALERLDKLQLENQELRGQIRQLQDQQFGTSTEKQTKADRSNTLEGFDEHDADHTKETTKKRVTPTRRNYDHLPKKIDVIELPADEQTCPKCGQPRQEMTETEDSDQLEIEVKAYRRVIRRNRYRKICNCTDCQTTIAAPVPPKLLPKSLLGTSIWIEILLSKYLHHQPIERLLGSWKLMGLDLAASTVNTGLERLQPLFTPIYEAIRDRNRLSKYHQADETRWFVFAEKAGKIGYRWWLWVFLGEDTVVFVLDASRSHEVPQKHFDAEHKTILMVDRYTAYQAMQQAKDGIILLAFCWAHVRRDFIKVGKGFPELKAWAIAWLTLIRDVYRCNRERVKQLGTPEFSGTDAKLRTIVTTMQTRAAEQLADENLRAPCRKALESLLNHWEGLTRFVEDPRIPMDNNASERAERGPAVGRKNYYGSGSEWSGQLAMMLFSIFATLQRWKINPRTWLRWYLDACAKGGGKVPADVSRFLPWNLSDDQRKKLSEAIPFERSEVSDSS
jgi:transposase